MIPHENRIGAVGANLEAMQVLLAKAHTCAIESVALMRQGDRNGAIGAVLGVDELLHDARSLYTAAIALHRASRKVLP